MQACDVKYMLKNSYKEPCFFVNYNNVGRGLIGGDGKTKSYIKGTKALSYWRIIDDKLQEIQSNDEIYEILFDTETYLFQWTFEYVTEDNLTHKDTLFYYWKGINASKGYSPLPPQIENENTVVERICQWSEPALFFHIFSKNLIVLSGSHERFDPIAKRLFIVRGELQGEIHLYEVPCLKKNLRSRGIFILINPSESTIYYWCGIAHNYYQSIQSSIKLKEKYKNWINYEIVEIQDGHENTLFNKCLGGQSGNYIKLPKFKDFTPRLFYFNSITGDFLATEVEYPLRSETHHAAFPFLQSHLYTAEQPALFLLDNDTEIWLWEGWKTPESNTELFETELTLAKETVNNYAKEKGHNNVKHVLAGLEPLEFTNIFPYWNERNDVAELHF